MQEIRRSFLWLALAWGAALALLIVDAVMARAQTEPEARRSVEEIVVTAQKREESLQEAPLSVSALTGDQLEQIGFYDVNDVRTFVPNLNVHANAGGNTGTTVSIRGAITGDPIITFEPAVGIYVDGVYISKSVGSLFDAPDLERVEVLRGPQGTLYGRNTLGGAINLIPRKPQDDPEALVRLGGGNFDSFNAATTLDSGKYDIGDGEALGRLGVRGTAQYRLRDGMFDNQPINGVGAGDLGSSDFDDLNRITARIITRWEIRDNLTLDYSYDHFKANEEPTAFQLTGVREGTTADALFANLRDFVEPQRVNAIGNNRIMQSGDLGSGLGSLDLRNELLARMHNITGTADFESVPILGDIEIKSISGWRDIDLTELQDLDGTPIHITDFQLYVDQEQFSQELQMVGDTWEDRIEYAVGFFYFEERGGEDNPQIFFGQLNLTPSRNSINRFSNNSWAPYGQMTVRPPILDERLSLTAGLRYTWEKKRASRIAGTTNAPVDLGRAEEEFDNFSPMASIAFDIIEDVLGYYRFAQGFKSGGFNGRAVCVSEATGGVSQDAVCPDPDLVPFDQPFKEEIMTSHEVGFKTEWWENRIQLNATGFFQDIEDKQVSDFRADPRFGAVTFVNNADQEVWGAELEGVAVPIDNLTLRLAYALLRPEYTRFIRDGVDVSDVAAFVNSPEHTVNIAGSYSIPTDYGVITIAADGYWQDDEDYLLFDNEFIHGHDYFLANGRLQLGEIPVFAGHLELGLWGRNLFDRGYRTFGIDFGNLVGVAGNTFGDRRTFGLDVTWRWSAAG